MNTDENDLPICAQIGIELYFCAVCFQTLNFYHTPYPKSSYKLQKHIKFQYTISCVSSFFKKNTKSEKVKQQAGVITPALL